MVSKWEIGGNKWVIFSIVISKITPKIIKNLKDKTILDHRETPNHKVEVLINKNLNKCLAIAHLILNPKIMKYKKIEY